MKEYGNIARGLADRVWYKPRRDCFVGVSFVALSVFLVSFSVFLGSGCERPLRSSDRSEKAPLVEARIAELVVSSGFLCFRNRAGDWSCWGEIDLEDVASEMNQSDELLMVASGETHVCGLTSQGVLRCFGYRAWDGRRLDDESGPIQRHYLEQGAVIPPPEDACCYKLLAISGSTTCALSAESQVVCWGYIVPGGQETPRLFFRTIALFGDIGCGIASDGEFHCWGFASEGLLDTNGVETADFQQISIATQMACGLDSAGVVSCWGRTAPNALWQEGYDRSNYEDPRNTPSTRFQKVEVGVGFVCGLTATDEVECWGDGNFGKLRSPPGRFRDISVLVDSACALSFDDVVHCWGAGGRMGWMRDAPIVWHR